jgi:uncharacterized membrane protein YcaP (DUF421 family)
MIAGRWIEDALRALAAYGVLLALFRLSGKRTLAELTAFDLVVVLLIGTAARPVLLRDPDEPWSGIVAMTTLVAVHFLLGWLKIRLPRFGRWVDGCPVLLIDRGRPIASAMRREHVDEEDVRHAARQTHGIDDLDQVERAYLELDGTISIVPRRR